jgi:tetratricopeptide (TPR) repeat protein
MKWLKGNLPAGFILCIALIMSCTSRSHVEDVVKSFFGEINHSNFESAKAKYLSATLSSELDSPVARKIGGHKTIQDSFKGFAGSIDSVEVGGAEVKGEQTMVKPVLVMPWGTKFTGTMELIKESGRDWKINEWGEFKQVGSEHINNAANYCKAKNLEAAISEYQAAQAENPRDAVIPMYTAACYVQHGNFEMAKGKLQESIGMYPDVVWTPYISLSYIYLREGNTADAEKALQKAVKNKPDDAGACRALAWFYADRGTKAEEAVELAKKCVTLAPDDAGVLDTVGWAYYRHGDRDQALKYLGLAAAKQPANNGIQAHYREVSTTPAAHLARAQNLLRKGDPANALAECDATLRGEPSSTQAKELRGTVVTALVQQHLDKAQTLFGKQQYDQAVSECDLALSLDAQNIQATNLKSRILETKKTLQN